VYDKDINFLDNKNDILLKWIITNSLGEKTKKITEGQGKTLLILSKSFTRSPEKKKLKNKINNLKFNEDDDINIFIFIQNSTDEY